jgi:hypothetical protein
MLASPTDQQRMDMFELNDHGYIDIKFVDATGRGLNLATITDTEQEFSLLIKNESGKWEAPQAVGILGAGEVVGDPADLTFRYYFSGSFIPGVVRVQFAEDSFRDLDGAGNAATEQQFAVVANAPAFEIRVDGSMVWRNGYTDGLFGDLDKLTQLDDVIKSVEQVIGSLGPTRPIVMEALRTWLKVNKPLLDTYEFFLQEPNLTIKGFARLGSQAIQGDADPVTGAKRIIGGSPDPRCGGLDVRHVSRAGRRRGSKNGHRSRRNGVEHVGRGRTAGWTESPETLRYRCGSICPPAVQYHQCRADGNADSDRHGRRRY